MSTSALTSLSNAIGYASSGGGNTTNATSKSTTSAGSLSAKQQAAYDRLQSTLQAKQKGNNSQIAFFRALNPTARKADSTGFVSSIATDIAGTFAASATPNFNLVFNNIQNAYIDRINVKVKAYQDLATNDPKTKTLQASLASYNTQLKAVQTKLNSVISNSQILQSIGIAFGQLNSAVGDYTSSTDPTVQANAQASFNSLRDSIVHDLALLNPTQSDQYSTADNLGQLQSAFTQNVIGGVTLPNGGSFKDLQVTDFAVGAAGPNQITISDLTNIQGVYNAYNSLQDGVRQSLEVTVNRITNNITDTSTKISTVQKADLKVAYGQLAAYKLQVSTFLTSLSNSFDNNSQLSTQLANISTGGTKTGSVLDIVG